MRQMPVDARSPAGFERLIGEDAYRRFARILDEARDRFGERSIWNVNSTATGGGVAEMLGSLLAYAAGAGFDARWLVVDGGDGFFDVTKRLHNRLHDNAGDEGGLGDAERRTYEGALRDDAKDLAGRVSQGDLVILHDPQTVGLAEAACSAGATVVWRCHVGVDDPGDLARSAWEFLRPYVTRTDAQVFSRRAYVWDGLDPDRVAVIAPSIDAFSPKNQPLGDDAVGAILQAAGIVEGTAVGPAEFLRPGGAADEVRRRAEIVGDDPIPPNAPIVVQVSRWDALKDPVGVLRAFADRVPESTDSHLVLAGPAVASVDDDPEGSEVLEQVREAHAELPPPVRARVHPVCVPMDDEDENGAIVNALQRRADVVVQKSLAEGFGLTVAEAMWKGRPVVASAVGGIRDQLEDGVTGLLVEDPTDLETFGRAVTRLLEDRPPAEEMGRRAHERVRDDFLAPRHLAQFARLLGRVAA
jgi:trehalose synthase